MSLTAQRMRSLVPVLTPDNLPHLGIELLNTPLPVAQILDGQFRVFANAQVMSLTSPFDGRPLGEVTTFAGQDLDVILEAAQTGFESYRKSTWAERAQILENLALLLEAHQEPLKTLIALEVAKPVKFAGVEIGRSIQLAKSYAAKARELGEAEKAPPETLANGYQAYRGWRPVGPVLAYTPFNFPLNLLMHKLAPAIGAGCSIVVKPTPRAPLTALYLAQLCVAAGYQAISVVNLTNEQAMALVKSPVFKVFSFTGGNIGWKLAEQTPVQTRNILELGSNSALIIEDVPSEGDLPGIAQKAAMSAFGFAGQSCISTQRILVNESLYTSFVTALESALAQVKQGDIFDPSTDLGPMVAANAASQTQAKIFDACAQGARILGIGEATRLERGNWLKPTVLLDTTPDMAVNRQESFAPLVTVAAYKTFDEALALAESTNLGLHAGIYTQSPEKILQAQETLSVRGININEVPSYRDDRLPYGGVKDSGIGCEGVDTGIEDYSESIYRVINPTLP